MAEIKIIPSFNNDEKGEVEKRSGDSTSQFSCMIEQKIGVKDSEFMFLGEEEIKGI